MPYWISIPTYPKVVAGPYNWCGLFVFILSRYKERKT